MRTQLVGDLNPKPERAHLPRRARDRTGPRAQFEALRQQAWSATVSATGEVGSSPPTCVYVPKVPQTPLAVLPDDVRVPLARSSWAPESAIPLGSLPLVNARLNEVEVE